MALPSVLITGCSDNGIVLHERGYHVFAGARNLAKMTWLEGLKNVTPITLDITQAADIQAARDAIVEFTGGTLDLLINNAARNHFMPILDEKIDDVRQLYEVNLIGPLALTQAFAPLLIKVIHF
jgi:1-acylglycerone phosphate reductase